MSMLPQQDPVLGDTRTCDALDLVIVPRARDLGGFAVRRALPHVHALVRSGMHGTHLVEKDEGIAPGGRLVGSPGRRPLLAKSGHPGC
jgi:hypothetical protein